MQNRMKKILSAILGLSLVATMSSCTYYLKKKDSTGATAPTPMAAEQIASAPADRTRDQEFNTEEYGRIVENEFLEPRNNPLSTFSIDVDTASYSNLRRFISQGQLPPKDAVRIEEMINYFKYQYPQPTGEHPFSITTEMADCPWNLKHRLVQIGLQGKDIPKSDLPPSNLVFLIDVSGSMNTPDKLPLLKNAFRLLVGQLTEKDRVAITVYAGAAGLVLPSTPGDRKEEILAAINALEAGGSTAGGEGIKLAYKTAVDNFIESGNNRVILATDGDFNVGVTGDGELQELIEEKRASGVFLTVLGFGTGNIKDSKMELLADKGNGNYAYIDSIHEARKVLVSEMGGTLNTIAKDVKIQIEFNPARVQAYRLIGYENRLLRDEDFNDDKKDAGELGAGHSVTALYEIIPVGVDARLPKVDPLKYQKKEVDSSAFASNELMTVKLRYKAPKEDESRLIAQAVTNTRAKFEMASINFKFAAAVAEFGLLLRESKFKGESSFASCIALARDARGEDEEGYRAEFVRLVETSQSLGRRGE
jgi:Ca-activated chloride channel family protein